ncbi:MAG: zinc metallopeptidase [Erysipelotrichales bacterium]|nr:zinc metallopeptidase [Erysipelotrichales bacterium]
MDIIWIYLLMLVIPLIASSNINRNYKKYKKVDLLKKKSGFEVARKILDENGLSDIYIVEVKGDLTDHYDPKRKTVRLSSDIFHGDSVAAASVAAHECGHAIQDKEGYSWMKVRSAIFPVVSLSNNIAYITLILGFVLQIYDLIMISVALTGISLLFQVITLPVEFDASRRAKKELIELNLIDKEELNGTNKVLNSAALTYVAGVLTTLLQMLYYLLAYRDRD